MSQNSDPIGVFIKAVAFAADKHRTQRRKDADASPYINHPLELANVLANEGFRGVHPEPEAVFNGLFARHAEVR